MQGPDCWAMRMSNPSYMGNAHVQPFVPQHIQEQLHTGGFVSHDTVDAVVRGHGIGVESGAVEVDHAGALRRLIAHYDVHMIVSAQRLAGPRPCTSPGQALR